MLLDGQPLTGWSRAELGPHLGYLPQDIELFDGTIAENIARFQPDASDEAIVAAARAAGTRKRRDADVLDAVAAAVIIERWLSSPRDAMALSSDA